MFKGSKWTNSKIGPRPKNRGFSIQVRSEKTGKAIFELLHI